MGTIGCLSALTMALLVGLSTKVTLLGASKHIRKITPPIKGGVIFCEAARNKCVVELNQGEKLDLKKLTPTLTIQHSSKYDKH